ncbi:hypothetical protein C1Y40_00853 [Mycobacterium talmoniae]|uniref:MoaB/Mog domain-containing protein n=1 Tax=Mycobacterium talmoniae TaxID=1858794 RepID=A0A2S8BQL1_9MYCO|nr:hypothetical protein C1Y40_00853 [Mycobacterium talmoniae]
MGVGGPRSVPPDTVASMEKAGDMVGRALVVVVDDRTAHGDEDHSGPLVTELLAEAGFWWTAWWPWPPMRSRLQRAEHRGDRRVDLVVSVGGDRG